jgi:eukaryotic-like serine/threonine-protein kinase
MEPSKRIGDYEVLAEIGRGGMGKVFRVRNVLSDRVDAMKVLLPDLVENQELAARFLREIKVLAALNHPNIAALRTALTADNQLVMIMEYVEGQSLAQRLRYGPIPTGHAIAYIEQVLDALDYAHKQHVVHRDIKPANMMLTPAGVVKLMDFGIARAKGDQTLTAADTTTGSLGYMSPEQVHGKPTDGRSDLYSVGISLYEMVTGERPFKANSDFAVMLAQVNDSPRPPIELVPALAPELNAIILKAIEKDPAARFQSAAEFKQALERLPAVRGEAAASTDTVTWPPAVPADAVEMGEAMAEGPHGPDSGIESSHGPFVDARTASPPIPPSVTPSRSGMGHPVMFVLLGGVLVIGALVGTGLYLGMAEAKPKPAPAADTSSIIETTPPASPAPAGAPGAAAAPVSASDPTPATAVSAPAPSATAAPVPAEAPAPPPPPPPAPVSNDRSTAVQTPPASVRPKPPAANPVASNPVASNPVAPNRSAPAAARHGAAAPNRPARDEAQPRQDVRDPVATLDQLEREVDQLTARVDAVNSGLDEMRREQARMGLGLRGDMAAKQSTMNINLSRAQDAIVKHDAARAQRYRDAAEADLEALEKFLGR